MVHHMSHSAKPLLDLGKNYMRAILEAFKVCIGIE